MAKVTVVRPKESEANEGDFQSVTISKAKGGFTVECRYAPKQTKSRSDMLGGYEMPKPTVFTDKKSMMKFVDQEVGEDA